jgi:hypothetical protein
MDSEIPGFRYALVRRRLHPSNSWWPKLMQINDLLARSTATLGSQPDRAFLGQSNSSPKVVVMSISSDIALSITN